MIIMLFGKSFIAKLYDNCRLILVAHVPNAMIRFWVPNWGMLKERRSAKLDLL